MQVTEIELSGVRVIEPKLFEDGRGYFVETYNQHRYVEAGVEVTFVQDNMSRSQRGTLRGLHYQVTRPQAKLVWAVEGEVADVVVDVRPGSPTFGAHHMVRLDGASKRQLFVPAGFAHGFCVLSDIAVVQYKCSDFYDPNDEAGIAYDDPALGIEWPVDTPLLSPKDRGLPALVDAVLPQTPVERP